LVSIYFTTLLSKFYQNAKFSSGAIVLKWLVGQTDGRTDGWTDGQTPFNIPFFYKKRGTKSYIDYNIFT